MVFMTISSNMLACMEYFFSFRVYTFIPTFHARESIWQPEEPSAHLVASSGTR